MFPISNWTELDVWQYIEREQIALPSIYYTHKREVVERRGLLVPVTELTPPRDGEEVVVRDVRFRTVGDITCTCPWKAMPPRRPTSCSKPWPPMSASAAPRAWTTRPAKPPWKSARRTDISDDHRKHCRRRSRCGFPATEASNASALRFITCGSVDDGKSTLIGRLLVDTRAVLQDQLAGVTKSGETDLALLTDGLSAEREQGITIDVAYRYFATESRKFIIGDAPGHEQYTRNMVTAASSADAAVVLVDATKLDWKNPQLTLLPQTRRHSLLAHLLRVHSLVFAVNKLDAVEDPQLAFVHIRGALQRFTAEAGIASAATVPVSALKGFNVVNAEPGWAGYDGPSLLQLLEQLPNTPTDTGLALAFPCSGWRNSRPRPIPARAAACSGAAWPQAAHAWATPCRSCPAASRP